MNFCPLYRGRSYRQLKMDYSRVLGKIDVELRDKIVSVVSNSVTLSSAKKYGGCEFEWTKFLLKIIETSHASQAEYLMKPD
ncbi:MAG: hypothetical protein IPJ75_15875 [Ignavibacteriales bacterium]|nr:hypothetical protein [Ignavibacteriales bacterium]